MGSRKSDNKPKTLIEKAADLADKVLHPAPNDQPPADESKDESAETPAESSIEPLAVSKKKKAAGSEMGEHKKFDKFRK